MGMMRLWPVDSLRKVFPDDVPPPGAGAAVEILAARGAVESAQFAIRTDADSRELDVRIAPPELAGRKERLADLQWRRVEFVPVRRPAWFLDPSQRLRAAPSFFPDPLVGREAFDELYRLAPWTRECAPFVLGNVTVPIWLTLRVPEDAEPGSYLGSVEVRTRGVSKRLPLRVEVSPARLPSERTLKLAEWLHPMNIADAAGVEPWSEEHWELLSAWGRNLTVHRANVLMTRLTELLAFQRDGGGRLRADFSRFDRWVETFERTGTIGFIEGSWLAGFRREPDNAYVLADFVVRRADGSAEKVGGLPVESPRARRFLKEMLRLLVDHLEAKGWLSIYYQHLSDEPNDTMAAAYRIVSDTVKEFAPELPRLDATAATKSLAGTVTIWCPLSSEAEKHSRFFRERQALGEEVWHYTCCGPGGKYPNRFISQPLLAVRVLHWFNFTAGLTGYLHWGLDAWRGGTQATAFCDTECTTAYGFSHLPPGDTHVIYPSPGGAPFDSIRHEMVLEGVQDYELLRILGAARPEAAMRLAKAVVPSLSRYERDPARFRRARRRLLTMVADVQGSLRSHSK